MTRPTLLILAALVAAAAACQIDDDVPDLETNTEELLGGLTFMEGLNVCSDAQKQLLVAAWERGRRAASTPEFEACMREGMSYDYMVCRGQDPFEHESRGVQMNRAIEASRTSNRALVGCSDEKAGIALAYTGQNGGYYHTADESMVFTSSYLDRLLAGSAFDTGTEAIIAGIFWHEALHTHGYLHDQVGWRDCGYPWDGTSFPTAQYENSANAVVQRCIEVAANANAAKVWSGGPDVRLGPGVYGAEIVGGVTSMMMTAGTGASLCPTCPENWNAALVLKLWNFSPPISYLRIMPRVVVFAQTQYGGGSWSLGAGVHGVAALAAAGVGNDTIRSIFVPAGLAVYACSDDWNGRGYGRCYVIDGSMPDTSWIGGISHLEIIPRVTTFAANDFYSWRQSFGLGAFRVLAVPQVRSIIVVPGQTAVMCTAPPGVAGRFCRTFTRSATDVGPELAGGVGYLEVSSDVAPTHYHVGASTAGGRIQSEPWGLDCGESCLSSFPAGSQIRLVATPDDPAATLEWDGCDAIVDGACMLTVNGDRSVSALFEVCEISEITECESTCSDSCAGRRTGLGTCIRNCLRGCQQICTP